VAEDAVLGEPVSLQFGKCREIFEKCREAQRAASLKHGQRCFEKESKFFKDGTRRRGKLLPAEAFLLIAENSLAMAARYQPELTNRETGEKQP
jgi:hypothetical protein